MRALMVMSILGCIAGAAAAQTSPSLPPAAGAKDDAAKNRRAPAKPKAQASRKNAANEALASCLAQWEKSTHMSRQEWSRACRRVADRLQNLKLK